MMRDITNPDYLRTDQYKDSGNLSKRASFHRIFGTNPVGWQQWLMGMIDLPDEALILELGTGPGYFWEENEKTIPVGCKFILTDISGGMLEEARGVLRGKDQVSYTITDAQEIPFPESVFDGVIANHMLYHVRDLNLTLGAIKKVLKPEGCFFAATNGKNHLIELRQLEADFFRGQR
jgi:ubiquinone/menaquinone biosynthesis C-methylase UbiE